MEDTMAALTDGLVGLTLELKPLVCWTLLLDLWLEAELEVRPNFGRREEARRDFNASIPEVCFFILSLSIFEVSIVFSSSIECLSSSGTDDEEISGAGVSNPEFFRGKSSLDAVEVGCTSSKDLVG